MDDRTERAKQCGARDGYAKGRKQDFADRGVTSFGGTFAGDHATEVYVASYLEAFQQALDDLRKEGVAVNDPRDKKVEVTC